jgi:hypothetical protein
MFLNRSTAKAREERIVKKSVKQETPRRLKLNRETIRLLDEQILREQVKGGIGPVGSTSEETGTFSC